MSARKALTTSKKIVVQLGPSVLTNKHGHMALGRVGLVVEQLTKIAKDSKQIFLVSSKPPGEDNKVFEAMFAQNGVQSVRIDRADSTKPGEVSLLLGSKDTEEDAAKLASDVKADLLVMLSNVDGIFNGRPGEKGSHLLDTLTVKDQPQVSGGMANKLAAAVHAASHNIPAIIANGYSDNVVDRIISGEHVGTLVVSNPPEDSDNPLTLCTRAVSSLYDLRKLSHSQKTAILQRVAKALEENEEVILKANKVDVDLATQTNLDPNLLARLKLNSKKISTLAEGIRNIAVAEDHVGRIENSLELTNGLVLNKETVPLGVLLVIFESRPDALPQVVSLALKSCNALILKGGKEASNSNRTLLNIINQAISPELGPYTFQLVDTREAVSSLLSMDRYINLVIPRGSNDLVRSIQQNTKISVMGHADGICHVYVDEAADYNKAEELVLDAKMDYPAACNAMETLLIHESWVNDGRAQKLVSSVLSKGVKLYGGPKASSIFNIPPATTLSHEYGSLEALVEVVPNVHSAVEWISRYGSAHTEAIVTENSEAADYFITNVESACVFHNASTRFADGFRFGLGAEVGISTGRLHARGPVGVQGLLTHRWVLRSRGVHTVGQNTKGDWSYIHKPLVHYVKKVEE